MNDDKILSLAREVFQHEIEAIQATKDALNEDFVRAVEIILKTKGKLITMGIGKSGAIARKIASTFRSTGTTALFVHPVECLHGDMGVISSEDVVLILSKSGESDEIRKLLVFLKNRSIPIIAMTARPESHLGKTADVNIRMVVPSEACPMGLAPMASTSVQAVLGDALAAALITLNDFKPDDFAAFHPAGTLGKRLLLKVSDVMRKDDELPAVKQGTLMKDALITMTHKAMGAILIVDSANALQGILTDGDLRRAIQKHGNLLELSVDVLMTKNPVCAHPNEMAIDALHRMEKRMSQISVLPVVENQGRVVGILRLHDLILAGL